MSSEPLVPYGTKDPELIQLIIEHHNWLEKHGKEKQAESTENKEQRPMDRSPLPPVHTDRLAARLAEVGAKERG